MSTEGGSATGRARIDTAGGAYVEGKVKVEGGDFIGRDQITHIHEAERAYDVRGLSNPYLGLRAYTYKYRARYAGRTETTTRAVELLTTPGEQRVLLFVTGASGSGKSSFAQAGLLPALEQHYRERNLEVRWAVMRPSRLPLAGLAEALRQLGLPAENVFAAAAPYVVGRPDEAGSDDTVRLLVIDQFEELFTQSKPDQRDALLDLLESLPPFSDLRMHIIVTMRVDYLPDLFIRQPLYELAKQGVDLRAMTADDLKDAIQQPIRQAYADGEKHLEPGLVVALAEDAAADATYLPLLQVTLEDLWRRGSLKRDAYRSLGDAIRQRAEEGLTMTTDAHGRPVARAKEERIQVLDLFLDLVEVSLDDDQRRDVRRQRALDDLTRGDPGRQRLVEELSRRRLFSTDLERDPGSQREVEVVDIIHESLILNWGRLQNEIAARRETLQRRARFEQALSEWLSHDREAAYLLAGVRLAEAEALEGEQDVALQSADAQQLLRESIHRREAQQRRRNWAIAGVIVSLTLALIIFAGLFLWATQALDRAERQTRRASAAEAVLAAQSVMQSDNVSSDVVLILTSYAVSVTSDVGYYTAKAEAALREAVNITSIPQRHTLIGHDTPVESVLFDSTGEQLVSRENDGRILVWEVATGQVIDELPMHPDGVTAIALSPDDATLAIARLDQQIYFWDRSSRIFVGETLQHPSYDARVLAFSPDGSQIVSAGVDGVLYIWDVKTGEKRYILGDYDTVGHDNVVFCVAYSHDGATIASAGWDGKIILWDAGTGEQLHTLTNPDLFGTFNTVAFSPDDRMLASGDWDGRIQTWDLATYTLQNEWLAEWGDFISINSVAFTPDGQTLISSGDSGAVRFWNAQTGELIRTLSGHNENVNALAINPAGTLIASGGQDQTVRLWSVSTQEDLSVLRDHVADVYSAAFNNSGALIVSGGWDRKTRLWDTNTGVILRILEGSAQIGHVDFRPDGNEIVGVDLNGLVHVWDTQTGNELRTFQIHESFVRSLKFHPDGQVVVSAGDDRTIRIWDIDTGRLIKTLEGHKDIVWYAEFDPMGQRIVSASGDATVRLWNAETGEPIRTLTGHSDSVGMAVFSPDGQMIASAGTDIRLWDAETGKQVALIEGSSPVAFSPDGDILAFEGQRSTIGRWDVTAQRELGSLNGHTNKITSINFSNNGRMIVSASLDETVRLWIAADIEELLSMAQERIQRTPSVLTDAERLEFGLTK